MRKRQKDEKERTQRVRTMLHGFVNFLNANGRSDDKRMNETRAALSVIIGELVAISKWSIS